MSRVGSRVGRSGASWRKSMAPSERAAISDHSETMLMMGCTIIFIVFVVAECQMELVVFGQPEKWVGCKLFNYPPSLVSHCLSVYVPSS